MSDDETLPVSDFVSMRVDRVECAVAFRDSVFLSTRGSQMYRRVRAPYFAAWLDRLGIPWTDDLRKAHEAGKGEA